jgi:hypothetical protein
MMRRRSKRMPIVLRSPFMFFREWQVCKYASGQVKNMVLSLANLPLATCKLLVSAQAYGLIVKM